MWGAIIQAIDHSMTRMQNGMKSGIDVANSQHGGASTSPSESSSEVTDTSKLGEGIKNVSNAGKNEVQTQMSGKSEVGGAAASSGAAEGALGSAASSGAAEGAAAAIASDRKLKTSKELSARTSSVTDNGVGNGYTIGVEKYGEIEKKHPGYLKTTTYTPEHDLTDNKKTIHYYYSNAAKDGDMTKLNNDLDRDLLTKQDSGKITSDANAKTSTSVSSGSSTSNSGSGSNFWKKAHGYATNASRSVMEGAKVATGQSDKSGASSSNNSGEESYGLIGAGIDAVNKIKKVKQDKKDKEAAKSSEAVDSAKTAPAASTGGK